MKRFRPSLFRVGAVLTVALLAGVQSGSLFAQQPPPEAPPPSQTLNPNQLDDLVAPIALYPDPLLSQVLVASTYPLELVQASQWLQRNGGLSGAALTQAAAEQNWDPSVQALVVFPDMVQRLNQDITWTTNLGNAFLAQEGDVMDAVQRMRAKAEQAGKLETSSQQTVTTNSDDGHGYIEIEPADPQVMYIPYYDPYSIWGPPLYYPYAGWGYSRGAFGFGVGIPVGLYFGGGWGGWGGWGWSPGWGGRTIIVNNNFIHRYNFNPGRNGSFNGRTAWTHDAFHRQGVPYANQGLANRFGGNTRQNLQARPGGEFRGNGANRIGNREIAPNNGNRGAFGGIRDGGAARMQSDHGNSSLGPARTGATPQMRSAPQQAPRAPQTIHSPGGGGGGAPRSTGTRPSGGGGGGGNRGGGGGGHGHR